MYAPGEFSMEKIFQSLIYFKRTLELVWESSRFYVILTLFLTSVGAIVPTVQVWVSKLVIDRVAVSIQQAQLGTSLDWNSLFSPIIFIFVVWIIGSFCHSLGNGAREQLGFRSMVYSEYLVLKKVSVLDLAFFDHPDFFDKMDNARKENFRAYNLANLTISLIQEIISLTAMLWLLFHIHLAAAAILILTSAPQVLLSGYYAGRRFSLVGTNTRDRRMASYLSDLLGSRDTAKEIRLFGLHSIFIKRFLTFWNRYIDETKYLKFSQEKSHLLLGLFSFAGTASIWGYAIYQAVHNSLTIGDVALAFQAAERSRNSLMELCKACGLFYEHTLFASNLFSFLDISSKDFEGALKPPVHNSKDLVKLPSILHKGIEFDSVSFRYPGAKHNTLNNLSFIIKPGETVAIVGENGAGKTTLVKLLCRLYDPTKGAILINGENLIKYDLENLRNHIGVIFQDFVRFNFSAFENIGLGHVDRMKDESKVISSANKAGIKQKIANLPKGFGTILGKMFDDGVDLSGGEWQRLSLARAFMREAQILILDEPTATLDAFAEYDFYTKFTELTKEKTTIIVSHRFSTVRVADHILVMKQGELVEEGNHEELLNLNGVYAEMYRLQSNQYT